MPYSMSNQRTARTEAVSLAASAVRSSSGNGSAVELGDKVQLRLDLTATAMSAANEVVTVTIDATGGTFTITFGAQTTSALAWNASAATVQSALQGLSSIGSGNATVSLNSLVYTITFTGTLAKTNVGAVTTDAASLTGGAGTAAVAVVTQGGLTLDGTIETSHDGSTGWVSLGSWTQVVSTSTGTSTQHKVFGGVDRFARITYAIVGASSPSVTFSVTGEAV